MLLADQFVTEAKYRLIGEIKSMFRCFSNSLPGRR